MRWTELTVGMAKVAVVGRTLGMKLMKLTEWKRNGEGTTVYINPASVFGICRMDDRTYIDVYTTGDAYWVIEPVEEVVRAWEDAINDRG